MGKASSAKRTARPHPYAGHDDRTCGHYQCPHCKGRYQTAGYLQKHIRVVHMKRRDHQCPHCESAFGRAGDLQRHIREVHMKRKR